ncbi:MAG: AsmA-like C-terminal region-containing protein, partial [Pseudomonadota bacterium]
PKTRAWLAENLLGADVLDTKLGIRLTPGQEADVALSFAFRDAVVRALPELPPIRDGIGFASITDEAFTLTIEEGAITPPAGGPIDLSGSVFRVPDTDQKPPDGEVLWESDGGIEATLSLLDQSPFFLMEKAGRPVDLAEGRARLSGTIGFPIRKGVTLEEVEFDLTGELLDVRSDVLVPGRQLDAERLTLEATPAGLTIGGDGRLDDVPFRATWRQDFGPDRPPAEVAGTFNLSPAAAAAFAPGLPAGTLRGASEAEVALVLPREAPARVEVTSTLDGLGISIPPVGWSKSPGSVGSFTIEGRLGEPGAPAVFDRVALSAPGLEAEGQLTTAPGGGLDRLVLSQARVGNWFRGSAVLRGRGLGRTPAIAVTGGRADLRRSDFGGGGGGGAGGPLSIALDQLTVAEGVALTGLRADLSTSGGLSGRFTASVNGGPQVEGSIVPRGRGRPALRIQASDAGRVLAAAGAFEEARGGAMLLVLVPDGGPGRYQGELTVEGLRLTAAPGLAAVLNTISVVGLLDQLNGTGLLFSSIQASFRLTPDVVELVSASGVGPSIGISADGYYDLRRERIDIRGVLSPLYALNSIGRVFTREGEGLFGFNYRVSGPSDDPNVAVNPLSVLTPGAFRQIFRASPPQRPGSGQ